MLRHGWALKALYEMKETKDFPGGSVAKTPRSQGLGFNPWSGNLIPRGATGSLHTAIKDPMSHNWDTNK